MLPKGAKRLRRAPVTVSVGKPLAVADMLARKPDEQKDALAWIGAETMSAIGSLIGARGGQQKKTEEVAPPS